MTVALWCVLIAGLMPYLAVGIAKFDRNYDNHDPRGWLAQQEGFRKRAMSAQLNGFEAFPLFASGVILAMLAKVPQATLSNLAIAFVAARIFYLAFYLADRAALRSLSWLVGQGASVTLLVMAAGSVGGLAG
ncbi:MAG: MAPEG family protein [Betaproteobacteria bacterium]|nr:MAPEG family protein [Betaproteobacteria bacterium]